MQENLRQYQDKMQQLLHKMDRDGALSFSMKLLGDGLVTVSQLYENVLSPCLNGIVIGREDEERGVWKEHLMTGIVRTVIENAYPFVQAEGHKNWDGQKTKRVLILCPEEEYHEIGARMGADFYTMLGFDTFFIGCNTPKDNFLSAFTQLMPDIISISISNYLNLVVLKKIIAEIRAKAGGGVTIILSGSAFRHTNKVAADFGADALINTFEELKGIRGEKS